MSGVSQCKEATTGQTRQGRHQARPHGRARRRVPCSRPPQKFAAPTARAGHAGTQRPLFAQRVRLVRRRHHRRWGDERISVQQRELRRLSVVTSIKCGPRTCLALPAVVHLALFFYRFQSATLPPNTPARITRRLTGKLNVWDCPIVFALVCVRLLSDTSPLLSMFLERPRLASH